MKRLAFLLALLLASPAVAQTVPDGNVMGRLVGGGAGLAVPVPIPSLLSGGISLSTPGFFLQTGTPPTTLVSWLNTNNLAGKNPYGYLGNFGQQVIATTYGEPALVGASRTSQTPSPNVCCAMGQAAVAINDNTTLLGSAWPVYATGARLEGTGSINNEYDVANLGTTVHDVNAYSGPVAGSSGALALQSGGEPSSAGNTLFDISYMLGIFNNGSGARHGIVFGRNLFSSGFCTTNCPAIDLPYGHELRWVYDGTDAYGSFIRGNNQTAGQGNGLVLTQFGTLFENAAGGILAQVAQNASVSSVGYVSLSSSGSDALIGVGTGNGATNANVQLNALGTGAVVMNSGVQLKPLAVASLPACAAGTKYQMYAVSDNNTAAAYGGALTGSGTNVTIAFCNGTAWVQH